MRTSHNWGSRSLLKSYHISSLTVELSQPLHCAPTWQVRYFAGAAYVVPHFPHHCVGNLGIFPARSALFSTFYNLICSASLLSLSPYECVDISTSQRSLWHNSASYRTNAPSGMLRHCRDSLCPVWPAVQHCLLLLVYIKSCTDAW